MSDLAPFVTAVIRDKVVSDLKEENDALKEEIRHSRRVQIASTPANNYDNDGNNNPPSPTIYQEAQFDTDGQPHANTNLWQVIFSNNHKNLPNCPLSQLANIQILLGDTTMGSLRGNDNECFLYESENDNDEEIEVNLCIAEFGWLTIGIHGWPIEQRNLDWDSDEALEYLTETVPLMAPEKTVSFKETAVFNIKVRGLIERLPEEEKKAGATFHYNSRG